MINEELKQIRVQVTQEDIDEGKAGDCLECPIALAMGRATARVECTSPEVLGNVAHLRTIRLDERGEVSDDLLYSYDLPKEAQRFIRRFDNDWQHSGLWPFEFDVELAEVERLSTGRLIYNGKSYAEPQGPQ